MIPNYIDTQVSMDTVSMYRIIHSMSMVVLKGFSSVIILIDCVCFTSSN